MKFRLDNRTILIICLLIIMALGLYLVISSLTGGSDCGPMSVAEGATVWMPMLSSLA